jgi:Predicted membrane protein
MGIRVIKTAAAAIAAIYTAHYIGLEPALYAGMLAILGVEVTRMKGLKSAVIRLVASVLGLFFASLVFTLFGFHYWAVAVFIMAAFPIMARFQLKDGIVTSSVIVFQLFTHGEVTTAIIQNQILLLLVGLGWATVINFAYMPNDDKELRELKEDIERDLGTIFGQMALTLRDPKHIWNGGELLRLHKAIEDGERRTVRHLENRFWSANRYWSSYFEMRRQQLDAVQHMLAEVALVYEKVPQGETIAEMLEGLAGDVKSDVYRGLAEQNVFELTRSFRTMELPKSREEFEVRAALLMLLHEVERYLAVAKRLKKKSEEPDKAAKSTG